MIKQVIVVGAGFFGATIAEKCASLGLKVSVIERRNHIGGNSYTYLDESTNVIVHKYGTHIFHTSSDEIWNYINQFSSFNEYKHKVLSVYDGEYFSIPINLQTLSQFFHQIFTPASAQIFLSGLTDKFKTEGRADNLEAKALQTIGEELYQAFFKGYTYKQWEMSPLDLPSETVSRIPLRFNFNQNYFSDRYEGIPVNGYTPLIANMLSSPLISVETDLDFFEIESSIPSDSLIVYTGPLDRLYGYVHGQLNWRTLDFKTKILTNTEDYQGNSVINYPSLDVKFTRIHEFKHLHPENWANFRGTVVSEEFSRHAGRDDEPYYPVNTVDDREKVKKYRQMLKEDKRALIIGGRLGTYQYLDMHMAIASALRLFEREVLPLIGAR